MYIVKFSQVRDFPRVGRSPVAKIHTPNPSGPGLNPGQETRSHMPQQSYHKPQLRPSVAKKKKKKISPVRNII